MRRNTNGTSIIWHFVYGGVFFLVVADMWRRTKAVVALAEISVSGTINSERVVQTNTPRIATDLLNDQIGAPGRLREAETWLLKYGANNPRTQNAADVTNAAAKDSISRTTLQRAKDRLGIVSTKVGEIWQWNWPTECQVNGVTGDGESDQH